MAKIIVILVGMCIVPFLGAFLGAKQMEEIVDMATCHECGHPTSLHAAKCLYCGASVSLQA